MIPTKIYINNALFIFNQNAKFQLNLPTQTIYSGFSEVIPKREVFSIKQPHGCVGLTVKLYETVC